MIYVKIINNSSIQTKEINFLSDDLCNRLANIDFSDFGVEEFFLHVVINADTASLKMASALPIEKRYIFYQGIPKEYAYNSSFEAKLATIRLRIQNINIPFEPIIDNLVFVVDFRKNQNQITATNENSSNISTKNASASSTSSANGVFDGLRNLFHKDDSDEDSKRKATFISVSPKYSLDKVIMNDDMSEQIEDALSIIRNRKKIYEEWGFNEVDPQPKAILSFWGPPGTGKTMCAHGIASAMKQKILAVNYAEIESKYAGESPKNLVAAFNAAQENNAILFFDEADSFLGKRISNVQSGHDQSINSLRSQMLIQLEDFEGIVIFATNLVKNFDPAFETRILRHIKFDLPDEKARAAIFETLLPSRVPMDHKLSHDDYLLFATDSEGFSGRDIRNSILDALSYAAKTNLSVITNDVFVSAIEKRQESYKKLKEEKIADNKEITENIKNSIIEKAKKDFNEALVGIALYAAWSDDVLEASEENLLKDLCVALNVEMPTGFNKEYLPPLSLLVDYMNTTEKKMKAIDMAIRVVAIDGIFTEEESSFITDLCKRLRVDAEKTSGILDYAKSLASLNTKWSNIYK